VVVWGPGLNTPGYPIRCQDHVTVVYLEALGPGTRNSLRRLPLQPGLHYLGDAIHLPPDLGIRILDCNLLGRLYEPCRIPSNSVLGVGGPHREARHIKRMALPLHLKC
jgi:hypothetical protein